MSNIKVIKFGGSSLADAEQFRKVQRIIESDPDRAYVIPSAPGRRFSGDDKVTDLLYGCYDTARNGGDIDAAFARVTERYTDIISGLSLDLDLTEEFEQIKSAITHHAGRDYAASRGEYLNGIILAKLLGYDFIDAAFVIGFNNDGSFDSEGTNAVLAELLKKHTRAVIPGFYGSMPNGTIKTFSRGGSDITGSIVARAVNARLYENFTDVSGLMMTDPRIVDNPRRIDVITYAELRELSYMGAEVFHEDAIFPVRSAGIPINIKNTNAPSDPGTMIVSSSDRYEDTVITGIAGKRGFSIINVEKDMMNSEIGFGRRLLEVIERAGLCFEHLPSGIDTMSVVVSTAQIESVRDSLIEGIKAAVKPDHVSCEDGIALLAVVGRGMVKAKGTSARVFMALANSGVNVRIIDQGSSELNIVIGIDEENFETATRAIYDEFSR